MKRVLSFILVLIMAVSFCACGTSVSVEKYSLTGAFIDGAPILDYNGSLILQDDFSGILTFNNTSGNITWSANPFTVTVNKLIGTGEKTDETICINFDEIGLQLNFSKSVTSQAYSETVNSTDGISYEGRFYFSDCEGEWYDYEGRSMALSGTLSNGKLSLYNKFYSESVAMVELLIDEDNCLGGYIMAYPQKEYDVKIVNDKQEKDKVNDTKFLRPEEYIWNMYNTVEETPNTENLIDVMTLSGNLRNSDGACSYKIVLTKS